MTFIWGTSNMFISLIESARRTQRSPGGALVSVVVHACVLSFAVHATANAGELMVKQPAETVPLVYIPVTPETRTTGKSNGGSTRELPRNAAHKATITISPIIPDSLPPIDSLAHAEPAESLFIGGTKRGDAHGNQVSAGSDSQEPLFASQVEKPAMPRAGNPIPRYPSLLESSRVEGNVLVQFVVDTLGVVDMRTFTVLECGESALRAIARIRAAENGASTRPRWAGAV